MRGIFKGTSEEDLTPRQQSINTTYVQSEHKAEFVLFKCHEQDPTIYIPGRGWTLFSLLVEWLFKMCLFGICVSIWRFKILVTIVHTSGSEVETE